MAQEAVYQCGPINGADGFGAQFRLEVSASPLLQLRCPGPGPSAGLQDLECLGKPAVWQPGLRGGPPQPAAQEVL
jgi:hypothetical protein